MHQNVTIQNELLAISKVVAGISDINVYSAPENYFEDFSSDFFNQLNENAQTDIPADYFKNLPEIILQKINLELENQNEIESGSILFQIEKSNNYTLPEKYFDTLPASVLTKVKSTDKVFILSKRTLFIKYTAAAALLFLLGISLFAIINYKKSETPAIVSSSTIMQEANRILLNNTFEKEMENVNDNDVVDYLEENGHDVDAALVASLEDEKSLPEEEDYFFDEKTLDNYLRTQNIYNTTTKSN